MLDSIIQYLQALPPEGILLAAFLITFAENIFPPSPSDMLLVFCGTLVGIGSVKFIPLVASATLGSIVGFGVMYYVGAKFGIKIVESGKVRFLPVSAIHKVEKWFQKYGYWLIVANRFLSGTRAVISFFAGLSLLDFPRTLTLSAVSALVWNCILCYAGWALGNNWREIETYISSYSEIICVILAVVTLFFVVRWYVMKRRNAAKMDEHIEKE
ncbi:MAG: DedA family protein [Ignavibacteriae bacterium]|nr:DedA family protein [Ignavibacteriota bacterium]